MSNSDKRTRRAKNKVKQARLQKQRTQQRANQEQIVRVPPDVIEMFQTLPGFNSEYESVPHLKKHVLTSAGVHRDLEMSVAILYVMYGYWKVSDSDSLYFADLIMLAEKIVEHPTFLEQFHMGNNLLVDA